MTNKLEKGNTNQLNLLIEFAIPPSGFALIVDAKGTDAFNLKNLYNSNENLMFVYYHFTCALN